MKTFQGMKQKFRPMKFEFHALKLRQRTSTIHTCLILFTSHFNNIFLIFNFLNEKDDDNCLLIVLKLFRKFTCLFGY